MTAVLPAMTAVALVAGLAQLCTRHAGALLGLAIVQAVAVALALVAGSWFVPAIIVLAVAAIGGPALFAWSPVAADLERGSDRAGWSGFLAGAVGAALAAQVPVIGLAGAVVFVGLVLAVTRRDGAARLAGLLSMQHGVALAACSVVAPELPTMLVAVLPLIPGLMVGSLLRRRSTRRRPGRALSVGVDGS